MALIANPGGDGVGLNRTAASGASTLEMIWDW